MEVLILVTCRDAAAIAAPLAQSCTRAGISWGAFFTNDGVEALQDTAVAGAMAGASRAVACQESWNRYLPERACPVELGSQTDNSAMLADAERIVSL